jgi:hypothetical protein
MLGHLCCGDVLQASSPTHDSGALHQAGIVIRQAPVLFDLQASLC